MEGGKRKEEGGFPYRKYEYMRGVYGEQEAMKRVGRSVVAPVWRGALGPSYSPLLLLLFCLFLWEWF